MSNQPRHWVVLVQRMARIAGGHPAGAEGVRARCAMEALLAEYAALPSARAADPFLLAAARDLAGEWSRRVEDEARERLAGPLLAACEALLAASRPVKSPAWMMAG